MYTGSLCEVTQTKKRSTTEKVFSGIKGFGHGVINAAPHGAKKEFEYIWKSTKDSPLPIKVINRVTSPLFSGTFGAMTGAIGGIRGAYNGYSNGDYEGAIRKYKNEITKNENDALKMDSDRYRSKWTKQHAKSK